ncbi:MAG: LacI family DNA-binding transcriptional regulator [Firmicutes bacterium]|nr:LacI family DNA-binding transcriptional regulator [Bacillota bacterium]
MSSVTIKDVAKLAGVSLSTASYVLNNKGAVSEKTRDKVLLAARKLNYKPNAIARSLVTGSSKTIGLLIPDISDPYFTEIVKGVEECANSNGYSVILCNTDRKLEKENQYFNILKEKRADGIILTGGAMNNDRHLLRLEDDNIAVVVIGRHSLPFRAVVVDNVMAAREVTEYLLGKGHRRIGFISGSLLSTTSQDRLEGYKQALAFHGVPYDESLVSEADFKVQGGMEAARRFFELPMERRPTAVFAGNDQMAIGVMGAAREYGLRVPEDIAVVGFDDIPLASLVTPSLTTVRLPMYEMGYKAMELLLESIAGDKETHSNRVVFCGYEFVMRDSA